MLRNKLLQTGWRGFLSGLAGTGMLALMLGCPSQGEYRELGQEDDVTNTTAHEHHHDHGPHGGHIVELGDYHGEVVMDDGRTVTLYILDGDAETAVPVANANAKLHAHAGGKEKEIELTAAPQEGETDGKTSRFTAAAELIPESIKDIEDLTGEVILVVEGKESIGEITHDHGHGHEHEHEEGHIEEAAK